jgi:hypothetical protein
MDQQEYAACPGSRVQPRLLCGELPKVSYDVGIDDSEAFEYVLHVGEGERVSKGGKFQHRI